MVIVLLFSGSLLLLDCWTRLEINSYRLFYLLLFLALSSLVNIIAEHMFDFRRKWVMLTSVLIIGFGCMVLPILTWAGDYKTQEVLFQNRDWTRKTIEFQMMDVGAFGYNRRTVERVRLIPFIDLIEMVDDTKVDTTIWKPVNIYVNELGLKGG